MFAVAAHHEARPSNAGMPCGRCRQSIPITPVPGVNEKVDEVAFFVPFIVVFANRRGTALRAFVVFGIHVKNPF